MTFARAIVWLRRDLRLSDNVALFEATRVAREIIPVFIVDPALLASPRIGAPIAQCFFDAVGRLRARLRTLGSDLAILAGDPPERLVRFARKVEAQAVFFNRDFDPAAIARDDLAIRLLTKEGVAARSFLDHIALDPSVVRGPGGAYRVYTPFKRRWRDCYAVAPVRAVPSERAIDGRLASAAAIGDSDATPSLERFGFTPSAAYPRCSESYARMLLKTFFSSGDARAYGDARDVPSLDRTSHLSTQLRAGTIGIRTCFQRAFDAERDASLGSSVQRWTDQLIWREFYQNILESFPKVDGSPFVANAARIPWRDDGEGFTAWSEGRTGYPLVDAGMRQLNETGWMHNRLRMITASFLTKHLLVDWRLGERYFETHLADADLAQNNGGWQWAASTGTDAVPYFRIFNPIVQGQRFDPDGAFVRKYIPELHGIEGAGVHEPWKYGGARGYPPPIVDHAIARARAIETYRVALARS